MDQQFHVWFTISFYSSEECIAIELETLKINSGESYLDFRNRIQHTRSTLIAKVNVIDDNMALNVFLYNLPEDLLRIVRLKGAISPYCKIFFKQQI